MGMIFWIITICVVCIIAGVIFYKPYLGVVFVIVSIPFEGIIDFGCISIYPLEAILAILVCICVYKLIVSKENYFRNRKLVFYYLPFMLCILISSLKSMELSLTIKEIVRWLELIVIYYLTINLINDDKKMRVILYSIFLTVAMVSILGIISYLSMGHKAISLFGNPNPLAGYVNLIIPVLFGMLMTSVFLWERITLSVITVLSIMTWFLAFSRSAWLSLILTMILVFSLTKINRRIVILVSIMFTIFAVTIFFLNIENDFVERVKLSSIQSTLGARLKCYPMGFDMVKDDLVFGIGTGNYPLLIKKSIASIYPSIHPYYTNYMTKNDLHNLYLQIFVVAGLMGLCAFVFWLAYIIKYLMSALKLLEGSSNYGLFVGLVGGVIVYLINNFANVLTVHGIHLQWGIILGLAVVLTQFKESRTCPKAV